MLFKYQHKAHWKLFWLLHQYRLKNCNWNKTGHQFWLKMFHLELLETEHFEWRDLTRNCRISPLKMLYLETGRPIDTPILFLLQHSIQFYWSVFDIHDQNKNAHIVFQRGDLGECRLSHNIAYRSDYDRARQKDPTLFFEFDVSLILAMHHNIRQKWLLLIFQSDKKPVLYYETFWVWVITGSNSPNPKGYCLALLIGRNLSNDVIGDESPKWNFSHMTCHMTRQ